MQRAELTRCDEPSRAEPAMRRASYELSELTSHEHFVQAYPRIKGLEHHDSDLVLSFYGSTYSQVNVIAALMLDSFTVFTRFKTIEYKLHFRHR